MRIHTRRKVTPGAPPGIQRRARRAGEISVARLALIDYDSESMEEHGSITVSEAAPYFSNGRNTWVHVQGEPDIDLLHELGDAYSLHALALEDVVNLGQRPKLDTYEDQVFVIVQIPELVDGALQLRQFSLFLGEDWLVTFHSGPQDPFEQVRSRLRNQVSPRIRKRSIDYLFYALLDMAVDLTFPVLDQIADRVEDLESALFENPDRESLDNIHSLKRQLLELRRSLWPQREVLSALVRDSLPVIRDDTRPFLRDCYDHTIQAMDILETFREMASGLLDVYLSSVSNRMNDVMKVLTIISTMFIPLSFLVGVYGMNFDPSQPGNMPELALPYAYPVLLLSMALVVGGMLYFFRRRGWI